MKSFILAVIFIACSASADNTQSGDYYFVILELWMQILDSIRFQWEQLKLMALIRIKK